jgi:prefoldin subunit 5
MNEQQQKGFRIPPQLSKNESVQFLNNELQNIQMASKVMQMMLKQLMENFKNLSNDFNSVANQLYELQYNFSAVKKHLNLDENTLTQIANVQRLKDFDEASQKEDVLEHLVPAPFVEEDSTISIRSTAIDVNGVDKGIFRSRIKLSESGVPALITALKNRVVGDKVTVQLNGLDHEIELLSIREPKKATEEISLTPETTAH